MKKEEDKKDQQVQDNKDGFLATERAKIGSE